MEMEIKFKLDMVKAAKATVAIAAPYGLGRVSKGTKYPQLTFANAIALITIIAITAPAWHLKQSNHHDTQCDHSSLHRGP
jgi:hypothetical protein